jgi:hypothetical protein
MAEDMFGHCMALLKHLGWHPLVGVFMAHANNFFK